jgi:hypothetical protein
MAQNNENVNDIQTKFAFKGDVDVTNNANKTINS